MSAAKRRADKKRMERIIAAGGGFIILIIIGTSLWRVSHSKQETTDASPPPTDAARSPTDAETPVLVKQDPSGGIARSYREARASVEAKDFENAAVQFRDLLNNPTVQEPTRTWAGLEAVLAHFINGRPADARNQAEETLAHMRSLPEDARHIGGGMPAILKQLGGLAPVSLPDPPGDGAARVVAAMLAGLKDWEQGMIDPAASCFKVAISTELPPTDEWVSVYQKIATNYLEDYQSLTGPLFHELPTDKAACMSAIDELDEVLVTLKTRGRARFNVRAWQLDLARHGKLLEDAERAAQEQRVEPVAPAKESIILSDVLARLGAYADACRFLDAITYLKSLPADPNGTKRSSLLAVAESSAVFLSDIEHDLAKQPVATEVPLKSGETMVRISIDPQGQIIATTADGQSRACKWSDFSADALIALHRVFVKKSNNEMERQRRHECAIAYDWLAGNRERANAAAAVLSQGSPSFKRRWDAIVSGLPH